MTPPLHFCHQCSSEIRPLLDVIPKCPRCGSEFLEEVPESPHDHPQAFASHTNNGPAHTRQDAQMDGSSSYSAGASAFFDVGNIISNLFSTLTGAGVVNPDHIDEASSNSSSTNRNTSGDRGPQRGPHDEPSAAASGSRPTTVRRGTTALGPINVEWQTQTMEPGAFAQTFTFNRETEQTGGGEADDAQEQEAAGRPSAERATHNAAPHGDSTRIGQGPVPLATFQSLLSNLFGTPDDAEPSAEDPVLALQGLIGSILGIPENGRMGDYVFGQTGLDDVITHMMEQTQGNGAHPPASGARIAELKRFKSSDVDATKLARNRECPTCLDTILESTAPSSRRNSVGASSKAVDDEDDPPEVAPQEPQVDDALILLPCKHAGHEVCVVPWLQRNGTCPICRVSVQPVSDNTSDGDARQQSSDNDGNTSHRPSVAVTMTGELPDTDDEGDNDEEQDTPQDRLRRIREATDRRMRALQQEQQQQGQSSMPGGFGPAPHSGGDPYGLD